MQLENNFDCGNLRVLKEYLVEVGRLHPSFPDVDEGFLRRHENYSKIPHDFNKFDSKNVQKQLLQSIGAKPRNFLIFLTKKTKILDKFYFFLDNFLVSLAFKQFLFPQFWGVSFEKWGVYTTQGGCSIHRCL